MIFFCPVILLITLRNILNNQSIFSWNLLIIKFVNVSDWTKLDSFSRKSYLNFLSISLSIFIFFCLSWIFFPFLLRFFYLRHFFKSRIPWPILSMNRSNWYLSIFSSFIRPWTPFTTCWFFISTYIIWTFITIRVFKIMRSMFLIWIISFNFWLLNMCLWKNIIELTMLIIWFTLVIINFKLTWTNSFWLFDMRRRNILFFNKCWIIN